MVGRTRCYYCCSFLKFGAEHRSDYIIIIISRWQSINASILVPPFHHLLVPHLILLRAYSTAIFTMPHEVQTVTLYPFLWVSLLFTSTPLFLLSDFDCSGMRRSRPRIMRWRPRLPALGAAERNNRQTPTHEFMADFLTKSSKEKVHNRFPTMYLYHHRREATCSNKKLVHVHDI